DAARGVSSSSSSGLPKRWLPFPSEYGFEITDTGIERVQQKISIVLKDLDLKYRYKADTATWLGSAKENVWSRAARRRRERKVEEDEDEEDEEDKEEEEAEPALIFKIQLSPEDGSDSVVVSVRWMQGAESKVFESFCGMLKRRVSSP
ncbi:MAG: hypothetical protein Q9222_006214, partial [Ikaeria aurantiellina]